MQSSVAESMRRGLMAMVCITLMLLPSVSADLVTRIELRDGGVLAERDLGIRTGAVSPDGMDVLIECHDPAELARAAKLRSPLMGINNRNLKTMDISLDVGAAMLPDLPKDRIAIAESGLFTSADLARMAAAGARCFLIGESLMRADDVAAATKTILANPVAG